mmetsp:Transcript_1632/g.3229  ORF Transcript_1632/g.3229 Transcript_1632/m.3229 type:complete len:117 (-) Transcript_1632:658-1008(-)
MDQGQFGHSANSIFGTTASTALRSDVHNAQYHLCADRGRASMCGHSADLFKIPTVFAACRGNLRVEEDAQSLSVVESGVRSGDGLCHQHGNSIRDIHDGHWAWDAYWVLSVEMRRR